MQDLLFVGGTVLTMDPARPRVEGLAVRGDRILAVGEASRLRPLLAPGAVEVDLAGGCLLPAFHDSHLHLTQHGLELAQVDLTDCASLQEGVARVAERARELPPGSWVLGAGYALERWGLSSLPRAPLDEALPRHPVLLRSQDHHSAWANGLALQLAGITEATPDPPDGVIARDSQGFPTGFLLERALALVSAHVPRPARHELLEATWRAGRDLATRGVATVHHMAFEPAEQWQALADCASDPAFPLRVWACLDQEGIEHAAALGLATGQGGDGFTIGGAKFFADGALGSRTAWMLAPYAGTSESGVAVHGRSVLASRLPIAIAAGLTPVIHAIGDAAARAALDTLEELAASWRERGLRPRLEHAQHLSEADVARLGRLGVVASMQPLHLVFDAPSIRRWLPDRIAGAYAAASLLRAGARLAFGSDAPVAAPDVIAGLRAACRRQGVDGGVLGPDEALTVEEALAAYTRGAAWAIGRDDRSGALVPGFDADLVLVDRDPSEDLDGLAVRATLKGGRATFDPGGLLPSRYTRS